MYKILVIAPSWVGDNMLMQPMLMRLKQRHPDSQIDVLAPPWTAGLLHAMPEVSKVLINPFPHGALQLRKRYALGKELRVANYQQVLVLPNSFKSALVAFFANIPLRTGFVGESRYGLLNDIRKLDKEKLPLMVERFSQLAEKPKGEIPRPLSSPKLHVSAKQCRDILHKFNLTLDNSITAFCPGAEYGAAKRWPTTYFADIARRLHRRGVVVVLIGSGKDREVAEEINRLAGGRCHNFCGRTDLSEAIALLACAENVISNDSGLMHLAAALDRPMIALFGSSSPQFTPPLSPLAHVVQFPIECSPCFKRECPLGHFDCMRQLTPDRVWEKLQAL
jgi:heptosyltransferase-2